MSANIVPQPGLTFANATGVYGNETLMKDPLLCTLKTCDLSITDFRYIPNLAGNALFAIIFAVYLLAQIGLGIKFRSWSYMVATFCGLLLEIIGYVGRIGLHNNPFMHGDFLIYLVCLTIAPAFLSAAIYLCLSRIVVVYGTHLSYFRPRTYTIIFCSCDFISLLLQAAGGGIAASTNKQGPLNTGKDIMLAGLAFQVVSLLLFAVAAGHFAFRVWRNSDARSARYASLTHSRRFKAFLIGLVIATVTIFIRSVYRCAELSGGFQGKLFTSDEALFMVMEGVMLVFACTCLTVLHPGLSFQGQWREVNDAFHHKGENEKLMSNGTSDPSLAERGAAAPGPYFSPPAVPPRPEYNVRPNGQFDPQANTAYNPHPATQYAPQPPQQHSRQSSQQFNRQGSGPYNPQANRQYGSQPGF